MTDVGYLCQNCGSVHEVESVRKNLILDLRTAASRAGTAGRTPPALMPPGPAGSPPRPWRGRVRP